MPDWKLLPIKTDLSIYKKVQFRTLTGVHQLLFLQAGGIQET